jgi:SAM-dependent methyltransferase
MSAAPTTAELYDRAAAGWARQAPLLLSDFTARPFVLDWCEPVAGRAILDLGCGEGYVARQLRRCGGQVVGVDVSPQMIERARDAEQAEPMGIEFAVGDATDLSAYGAECFDLVVAVFLFNYLDRQQTAATMREVRRVLRRDGRFVFTVPHPSLPFLRKEEPPFFFERRGLGYFTARDVLLEGRIWRRDGVPLPVRCVHKTLEDYFTCLREAGFNALPELRELRVTDEHVGLDPKFFGPLQDTPLHLMFRTAKVPS